MSDLENAVEVTVDPEPILVKDERLDARLGYAGDVVDCFNNLTVVSKGSVFNLHEFEILLKALEVLNSFPNRSTRESVKLQWKIEDKLNDRARIG